MSFRSALVFERPDGWSFESAGAPGASCQSPGVLASRRQSTPAVIRGPQAVRHVSNLVHLHL